MKKIRVFCDPMVVAMATIVIMVIPVYTLLLIYVYSHNLYEDKTEGIKVLLFAIFVGMAAGFFPSLRAMKLSPLAAIRNE
jgi:ABC-type antimicrobial peptide transport system permease subunit